MKHVEIEAFIASKPASPEAILAAHGWRTIPEARARAHMEAEAAKAPRPHRYPRTAFILWRALQSMNGTLFAIGAFAAILGTATSVIGVSAGIPPILPLLITIVGLMGTIASARVPLSKTIFFGPAQWHTRRIESGKNGDWAPPHVREVAMQALGMVHGSWLELHELKQDQKTLDPVLDVVNEHGRATIAIYDSSRVYAIARTP